MSALGRFIRNRRTEKSCSLRAFAEQVEVAPTHLSEIELGRRNPSPEVMARIAQGLGVEIEELEAVDTRAHLVALRDLIEEDSRLGPALVEAARRIRKGTISVDDLIAGKRR